MVKVELPMTTMFNSFDTLPWVTSILSRVKITYHKSKLNMQLSKTRGAITQYVLAQRPQEANTNEALQFYQSTYGYTEDLRVVIEGLRLRIKAIVADELKAANQQQAFGIAVLILVLIISPVIIFLVRNATVTIQIFSLSLSKKAHELKMEKRKADILLFQVSSWCILMHVKLSITRFFHHFFIDAPKASSSCCTKGFN